MAAGKRPVPFRTRKLSPPAPMVLLPGGSGRVGYRRPNNFTHRHPPHNRLCGGCRFFVPGLCVPASRTPPPTPTMGATNDPADRGRGFVKPDGRVSRPGETASENQPVVNFYETTPPEGPCQLRIADTTHTTNGSAPRVCKTRQHHHPPHTPTSTNTPQPDDFCKQRLENGCSAPVSCPSLLIARG